MRVELRNADIVGIRAANPGPFTLSGTNTWILGRNPAWLVDAGPAASEHLDAVIAELATRGGLAGIALTHDHADHAEAVPALRAAYPGAVLGAARGAVDVPLGDGAQLGPLTALETPGHAPDHLAYLLDAVAFTGDAVLGEGSVFISPDPGALSGYLAGLHRLRGRGLSVLAPGHGPPVYDVESKLNQYIAHRLHRERRLLQALASGRRTVDELLDEVWADAPAVLRPAAAFTLAAHLDKLEEEGRLPGGVQRPQRSW